MYRIVQQWSYIINNIGLKLYLLFKNKLLIFAEPSIGIDAQGLATIETEQRVLVTEESSVSSVPAVSAAECTSAPASASAAIADTSQYTPNTVLCAQPAPEARN